MLLCFERVSRTIMTGPSKSNAGVKFAGLDNDNDDNVNGPGGAKVPLHGRALKSFRSSVSSNGSVTYKSQKDLPRLPIPDLADTLTKFRATVEPLQAETEQQATERLCESFLNGDGPNLQQALLDYERKGAENGTVGSYIEEFWNESYLNPNDSVVLNLNPFFVLEDGPDPKIAHDQMQRAASLCFASIKLASKLKHETLAPDVFRGSPLCMDQFKVLFGGSRQPGPRTEAGQGHDDIHVYPDSSHVAVLCHHQCYYFPVLWPETGHVAVDETDLWDIINAIHRHASSQPAAETARDAVGVLTSLPRPEWAQARQALSENAANQAALQVIDSALFVLVLDSHNKHTVEMSIDEVAADMLHGTTALRAVDREEDDIVDDFPGQAHIQMGTCMNRWYDKLQLIVCHDGTSGVNFEHAAIDGHTALRFVSDVFAETVVSFAETITASIHGRGKVPHVIDAKIERAASALDTNGHPKMDVFPKKLVFDLTEDDRQRIFYAETHISDQICASHNKVLEFKDYGKLLIVGNKMSPDAFVQMSMILAYYKLYGKFVCVYEPVLTKSFFHGRTEAMRSATLAAKHCCEVWCKGSSSQKVKLDALKNATVEHSRLVKEAAQGKGVDRHLFALKCIAERNNLPTSGFFDSAAWKTLSHTVLSTSNCGNPSLRLFGFGPVVADGFGIGYIIKDHGLSYSVASKHRQTDRYVQTLYATLKAMQELLEPLKKVQVKHRPSLKEVKLAASVPASYDDVYGESDFDALTNSTEASAASSTLAEDDQYGRYFSVVKPQRQPSARLLDLPHKISMDLDGSEMPEKK